MSSIAHYPAFKLVRMLREREISALELLDLYLDRVDHLNSRLNAIVTLDINESRRRAQAADDALGRNEIWGPLHGLPMTIKDSFDVAGLPSTWGLPARRAHTAISNSVVANRLLQAGAIIFGKTNVPAMLGDWQTWNDLFGTTNNPWDITRSPGGSSGGSAAAISAGLTAAEVGSDGGGSIRGPAHYCGVYGHKSSWGIIPLRGHSLTNSLRNPDNAVAGPLGRSGQDLDLLLNVLAGADILESDGWKLVLPDPRHKNLSEYKVAVMIDHPKCQIDSEYSGKLQLVADTLARAGATVNDTEHPKIDFEASLKIHNNLARAEGAARLTDEQFAEIRSRLEEESLDEDSHEFRDMRAVLMNHRDWITADEARNQLRSGWSEFFNTYDLFLCPSASTAATAHNSNVRLYERYNIVNQKPQAVVDQHFWSGIASVAKLPATTAPIGTTIDGMPLGIDIIGPYLGDRTTIDFAKLLPDYIGGFVAPPEFT